MKTLWNADSLSITHYFTGRRATIIESALADQAWLTFLISASCWSVLFRLPFDLETRARLLGIRNTAAKRSSFDNSWPDAFALNRRTWLPLEHLALIRGSSSLRSFSHLKVRRRKSIIYIYIYIYDAGNANSPLAAISPEAINRAGNEAFPRENWAERRARRRDGSPVEKGLTARHGISRIETQTLLRSAHWSLYARVRVFLFFLCRMSGSALESRGGDIFSTTGRARPSLF